MNDLGAWIAAVAGGGGALTLLAAGLLYVTKEAIARAVSLAGAQELERLKSELATQLDKERQAFTREVERERQSAARDLEGFKAELSKDADARRETATREIEAGRAEAQRALEQFKSQLSLEAEVRRQAAGRKVDVILRMIDIGNTLVRRALYYQKHKEGELANAIEALNEYWALTREAQAFFEKQAWDEVMRFGATIHTEQSNIVGLEASGKPVDLMALSQRAEAARNRFFDMLRRELRIATHDDERPPTTAVVESAPQAEAK